MKKFGIAILIFVDLPKIIRNMVKTQKNNRIIENSEKNGSICHTITLERGDYVELCRLAKDVEFIKVNSLINKLIKMYIAEQASK